MSSYFCGFQNVDSSSSGASIIVASVSSGVLPLGGVGVPANDPAKGETPNSQDPNPSPVSRPDRAASAFHLAFAEIVATARVSTSAAGVGQLAAESRLRAAQTLCAKPATVAAYRRISVALLLSDQH